MSAPSWRNAIESLLLEILGDARGDDEQLRALHAALSSCLALPADAFVIGEPVEIVELSYGGLPRRGLTARCRRQGGTEHVVSACDLDFATGAEGERYIAAYRAWTGLEPRGAQEALPLGLARRHKASDEDLDLSAPVELVVLAPKRRAARCLVLGTQREITLRSSRVSDMVPGEIITVRPRKQWTYGRHPYLSGEVLGHRLEIGALGLVPLELREPWPWDPAEEYWGEEDEPLLAWEEEIIAHGPRTAFEMEQVLPGEDPEDWDSDPILEASEANTAGDRPTARKLLVELLAADLRCLDAHAHLGNFAFDHLPRKALRHYEASVRIGELSLGEGFHDVLPWGRIDNRPFLRCMHGFGLCLWRVDRADEAVEVFERMLWLNPGDNQGIRFLLPRVRAGERWEDLPDHY